MQITEKAVRMGLCEGRYPLDGYNQKVCTDDVCFTITTRTFGDNNHFLLEIDETPTDTPDDQAGIC